MKKNNSQSVFEPNTMPFLFFLIVFAVATLILKYYYLAAAEGVAILALIIYSFINRGRKRKALKAYIESVTYDTETATAAATAGTGSPTTSGSSLRTRSQRNPTRPGETRCRDGDCWAALLPRRRAILFAVKFQSGSQRSEPRV